MQWIFVATIAWQMAVQRHNRNVHIENQLWQESDWKNNK